MKPDKLAALQMKGYGTWEGTLFKSNEIGKEPAGQNPRVLNAS